jgi:hypothetical protein
MPPRVSSRNPLSKRIRNAIKDDDQFIDDGSSDETNRKTRKTKTSKVERATAPWQRPRGRGKLKMLPEMPLDILLEVRYQQPNPFTRIQPGSTDF